MRIGAWTDRLFFPLTSVPFETDRLPSLLLKKSYGTDITLTTEGNSNSFPPPKSRPTAH